MITRKTSLERVSKVQLQTKILACKMNEDNVESFAKFCFDLAKIYFEKQGYEKPQIDFRFSKRAKRNRFLGTCCYKSGIYQQLEINDPDCISYKVWHGKVFEITLSRHIVDHANSKARQSIWLKELQKWIDNMRNDYPLSEIVRMNLEDDLYEPFSFLAIYETIIHELAHVYEGVSGQKTTKVMYNGKTVKAPTHDDQFFQKMYELLENLDFPLVFSHWYDNVRKN